MIVSFDIDDTLIACSHQFETEHKPVIAKILGAESLRKGTKRLFGDLQSRGHSVWIYTTSLRSTLSLRITFGTHGIRPSRIINQNLNQREMRKAHMQGSKNPNLFGIHIHVDDSPGVKFEGERYGFQTIIVAPDQDDWVQYVLQQIQSAAEILNSH